MTLEADTGFSPTIDSAGIQKYSGTDAIVTTVSHLNFAHSVTAILFAGSGHVIAIDHVSAVGNSGSPAISAEATVASTISVSSSLAIETGSYPGISLTSPVLAATSCAHTTGTPMTISMGAAATISFRPTRAMPGRASNSKAPASCEPVAAVQGVAAAQGVATP